MARSDARLRLVVSGVVASVAIHALLLTALALIPEPEEEPDCPTREEVCRAVCLERPEPAIPETCPELQPCDCELVVVEPIPEIVALPTPPAVVPEIAPPPMVAPEPVPPPPPTPPPPAPEPVPSESTEKAPVEKKNKAARKKAEAVARSVAVAKVLGTYGDAEVGSVFDVIESTDDNRLEDLFAQGMTSSIIATENRDASALVAGGGGGSADVAEESFAQAISRKVRTLQKCQTKDTAAAGVEGKLQISVAIDDSGTPTEVAVESDTTGSDEIRACVVSTIEAWRLPAGNPADTQFSVVFKIH